MHTIQVVLDEKLLRAADRTARRLKQNRSALLRDALREHLARLAVKEKERLDREGYLRKPYDAAEMAVWDKVLAWPED